MTPNKQYMDRISRLRREQFPHTTLPEYIDRAIPVIALVVCFVLPVALMCMGRL